MLETFYRIIMRTYNGKKLYLKENKWYGKNEENINCSWDFDSSNAIWFENEKEANNFCKSYFKNFKGYEIEEFEYYI